jgi:signal transduction histidine kinase
MTSVLIVDDEASIRISLRELMAASGYDAEASSDASAALQRLTERSFDVIVSDIVMPTLSGIELLRRIRAAAPLAQVIMMTGQPTADTAADALRAGAFDYLTKPVNRQAVLRAVGNATKVKQLDDERRRLEQENRRHQEQLEDLVRERTRSMEQTLEELKRTQQQIIQQERLKALGQMVSGIAHDFNNVLMPIIGLPEFLLAKPDRLQDRDTVVQALKDILAAARDAREIVRRLREFYRPNDPLEMHPVNLHELALNAIALTEPAWRAQAQACGKTIRIETTAIARPIIIPVNESGLREVLTNMIMNAVDATVASGHIRLELSESGAWAVIRLSDTGCGMTEEVRAHCFEPFYSTKGEHGTGLGLAVCHGIVHRHGGLIEVESVVGRGTTFTILLPRTPPPGTRAPDAPGLAAARRTGLDILVADDEDMPRALVGRYLCGEGHRVELVASGADALRLLAHRRFDLVVTDRAMPGMAGDELARAIKRVSPATPILMLSGFGDLMKDQAEKPQGVDAVMGKPVTPSELIRAVDHLTAPEQRA